MPSIEHPVRAAARPDGVPSIDMDATLFVALELSLTRWIVVAGAPGENKAGKHAVVVCDGPGLLALLDRLRKRAEQRRGGPIAVAVMQEAGRDGFWVHRLLEAHGVHSHVVDPSSIAVNRRSRRAKTDRIDGEAMLRTLMAWARGERQVCSMVHPPTREAEDARRLTREREALLAERIRHANRIKGPLATQGVFGFEPTWQDRRARLADLRTPEGEALPPRLRAGILRQVDRLELTMQQLAAVETERDAALAAGRCVGQSADGPAATSQGGDDTTAAASLKREGTGARLLRLKGIGPETAVSDAATTGLDLS
jgi:transposase